MKKYITLAVAAFGIAVVSHAQASQKQQATGSKSTMAAHTVTMTKSAHAPATVVTEKKANNSQQSILKRKHHKKTIHPKKMVDKK